MKSLYHAYEAFERRVERGEFSLESTPKAPRQPISKTLEIRLGEVLINAGLKLKRHAVAGKSMAWSPLTGSEK
jgi:hypothetical protein